MLLWIFISKDKHLKEIPISFCRQTFQPKSFCCPKPLNLLRATGDDHFTSPWNASYCRRV
ncbi:hypothetical protein BAE44_0022634 [Dichanthelium oligosanthes]|uniref:Uncharacterized protein n=1 Tax=Dichanthelium oligosanthes TaxID=888268 RepID=A0A1E5UU60_9POAL|nr:hypothetical protein BAE44_0022634 [Dichanthelium oligosanthes]